MERERKYYLSNIRSNTNCGGSRIIKIYYLPYFKITYINIMCSVIHRYLTEIEKELLHRNPVPTINTVMNDRFVLTQLILDCTSSDISSFSVTSVVLCGGTDFEKTVHSAPPETL